ncbi:MAG: periplasmic heavy metal sensor [Thermodesulfovibrionales bacterium]
MKKLVLLLAVVLLVGMSVSAYAMNKKGMAGKGMHGDQMMAEKFEALGLDEKQKETVTAIHLKTKKDMIKKKADVDVAQIELKELLGKDPVDLQAAEAKVKQIEALKTDMKMTHIRTREEVKKILTPDQKKKFAAMHDGCMECGEGAGGPGCGMHKMKGGMKGKCKDCAMMKDGDDKEKPGPHAGHKH